MAHQWTGLASQRGSVSTIVLLLIFIVIAGKLVVAIAPAQIGDYQLTKILESELKSTNDNNSTAKEFLDTVNRQMSVNADYDTKAEEVFTFTNNSTGQLAIHKDYQVTSNFFGNVDIVNRFEGDVVAAEK